MMNLNRLAATTPSAERFRTVDKVKATEQADTTILLDLRSGRYYTLNPVGGLIWSVLTTGASVDRVKTRLKETFDLPDEQLASDVDEFVGSLLSLKLIRRDR